MKAHLHRFFKHYATLLVFTLLVTNCERDTVFEEQEQSSFNSIVTYNQLPINVLNAIGEVAPDSDMAKKSNIGILIDKDYIVKMVDTLENTAYSLKFYFEDTPENVLWNLVVQSDEDDNVQQPYVMKYTIDNIEDIKGDDGTLDFTKMKGTIGYYTYDRFLNILNTSKANRSVTSMSSDQPCNQFDVNLPSDNFDDEDDSSGGGSAGGGGGSNNCTVIVWSVGDLTWVTVHCITYTQRSAYTAMANDCDPSGGGGPTNGDQNTPINGGGNNETDCPSGNIVNGECVPTTDIIINELTGKAKCVYDELITSNISSIHNMITQLFIEFGEDNYGNLDLTFKMSKDLPNNVGGKTIKDSNGNFHILINENLMSMLSSIEIGAILIHEVAHAFLGKQYFNSNESFVELYKKYINDNGLQDYSHDIMKDYFIIRMATVLKNYNSSIFSDFEKYKILASQGVFVLDDDQKQELNNVKIISRNNDNTCN